MLTNIVDFSLSIDKDCSSNLIVAMVSVSLLTRALSMISLEPLSDILSANYEYTDIYARWHIDIMIYAKSNIDIEIPAKSYLDIEMYAKSHVGHKN